MVRSFGLAFESTGFRSQLRGRYCLATLMSSDRTKQICLAMTIYIYIYIYIPKLHIIYCSYSINLHLYLYVDLTLWAKCLYEYWIYSNDQSAPNSLTHFISFHFFFDYGLSRFFAQFAGAVEYTIGNCEGVRHHPRPTSVLDMANKQSDGEVPVILELLGMQSTPSLLSLLGQLRPEVVAPDSILSKGQIELNCILMQKWIAWNRTILIFKLHSYAKVNCLKLNCFLT